jgi:hypothetical protein
MSMTGMVAWVACRTPNGVTVATKADNIDGVSLLDVQYDGDAAAPSASRPH